MIKISFIGAGSAVFTKRLVVDILSYPELQDCVISLMDIDENRLNLVGSLVKKIIEEKELKNVRLELTLNRRETIKDSNYVITTMRIGGMKYCEMDVDIPRKYGVEQCVGDIVGPGGVFRGLRTIPVLLDICKEMEELCPDACLLNYVNPMAIVTRSLYDNAKIKVVGICHSVVHTAKQLAEYLDIAENEITYSVAGINHMAWFLRLERDGKDLYPLLFRKMKNKNIYDQDKVRFEILKYFGYFVTESSYHMSEYVPYFRKDKNLISKLNVPTKSGPKWVYDGWESQKREIDDFLNNQTEIKFSHSVEYAADIIHSLETGVGRRMNLNLKNTGLITNLPDGCCVEVPCLVNNTGIHPVHVGDLPIQLAALNQTNINVQELSSKTAVTHDRDLVFQAIALDPLTGSVLSLPEIKRMVDEMFEKNKKYLSKEFY